jgi:sulfide dehydrogenase cytochrome subunit
MRESRTTWIILIASLTGLLLISYGNASELSRGAMLSASCEGCHGTNGHSPGSMPAISGKTAEYLQTALENFRSGETESTVMGRQAKGYTDEEIVLIAEYFARQK